MLVLACFGCAGSSTGGRRDVDPRDAPSPVIDSPERWRSHAVAPGHQYTGNLETVKFVVDLSDHNRAYFLDGHRYPLHIDFIAERFGVRYRLRAPMWSQYTSPKRRFLLGSLLYLRDADAWSFEILSEDNMDAARLLGLWKLLRAATYFGPRLSFRPTSALHDARAAELRGKLPLLDEQALLALQRYQPIQQGSAVGRLRLLRAPLDPAGIEPQDIIVTDDVPADLPPAAGLVTERLQAPLSHVAVLSANRGAPDMALRGALTDASFKQLEDQWVTLTVAPNGFTLAPAPRPGTRAAVATRQALPASDLERAKLVDLCKLRRADSRFAGAKAANLGDACSFLGAVVPAGFVVPFAYYAQHLRTHGLELGVHSVSAAEPADPGAALSALRAQIANAAVDSSLVSALQQRIRELAPQGNVRLRSSTNAEDLPGFNGAGLYDSEIVSSAASREELAQALARVWASVWNLRAFQERARHGIPHDQVAMAVLVQRSIDGAAANGVAISQNPFDPRRPAVFVNAQSHGASVTGARGDEMPEQWLARTYLPVREPQRLSVRSQAQGPVLQRAEVLALVDAVEQLHERYEPSFDPQANAVDVEWVLDKERRLSIVQVRPYLVRWPAR
jgi:hypothetical protein